MVDLDDVDNGFIFGGLVFGLLLLVLYFAFSKPKINACHDKGGVIVRIEGSDKCLAKDSLKEISK